MRILYGKYKMKENLFEKASTSTKNLVQIKNELKLDGHKSTIWRSLKSFTTHKQTNKASRLLQKLQLRKDN